MITDYAKKENRDFWLRHPTLGDPSFDTFEKIGGTVHQSTPPYEWGVNGSLFIDPKTGNLYLYAGLYPFGYAMNADTPCKFEIYRSLDNGNSWENLGSGFEPGFCFDGHYIPSDICPDVVLTYDDGDDTYWLCYDWCNNNLTWGNAYKSDTGPADSGAALAWSKSPEGPFVRLGKPFFSNKEQFGKFGIFTRGYASTLMKRKADWIVYILMDSGKHYSWGLACMTAKTPRGPWSEPFLLLSCARQAYYPAPVEFHPCFTQNGKVYAPATSVSKNRNYQAVFSADLEQSHLPTAWCLEQDGGVWHSRTLPDEKYGIWGQTFHGFVCRNEFMVMYPAKDERGYGTLSMAKRKWDNSFSDGFTFSGHAGKSIAPLLTAYKDFALTAEFDYTGTIEIAVNYAGILGPDKHSSDASPHEQSLSAYDALVFDELRNFSFIRKNSSQIETILFKGQHKDKIRKVELIRSDDNFLIRLNGLLAGTAFVPAAVANPIAIIAHEFSVLNCSKFEIDGNRLPYRIKYNSLDAILNAGQLAENWKEDRTLDFHTREHYIGEGDIRAKWNIIGDGFCIYSPKSPKLGTMEISLDGKLLGIAILSSAEEEPSQPVFSAESIGRGRHCVEVRPHIGLIALDIIEVS